jgi:hypothetical protein
MPEMKKKITLIEVEYYDKPDMRGERLMYHNIDSFCLSDEIHFTLMKLE